MEPGRAAGIRVPILAAAIVSLCAFVAPLHGEPPPATSCVTAVAGSWNNNTIPAQTAQFTATYDATPGQNNLNGVIGFSLNPAAVYINLAVITRFNMTGTIDVRNGSVYAADAFVPYSAGQSYHFRLIINPATQHYSVYVTPPGSSEIPLATNYAFRSEQSSITSLNNWAVNSGYGNASVCNMTITPGSTSIITPPTITTQPASQSIVAGQTATFSVLAAGTAPLSYQWKKNGTAVSGATSSSYTTPAETTSDNGAQLNVAVSNSAGTVSSAAATLSVSSTSACLTGVSGSWKDTSFATQTAQFTATFDATPGQNNLDGLVGFSLNPATIYASVAVIARFNLTGTIDARNGSVYAAGVSVHYTAGVSYHFRLIVNPATQHYSVYVTPPGSSEIALATNYAFRSEQSGISSLNDWDINSGSGTETVCNMTITPGTPSIITAPTITTQPASRSIVAGQTATFSVGASGTAPLSYQWTKNGATISGATSSSYTTPSETTSDNGAQFTVAVTDPAGSATSAPATLTVTSQPGTLTLSSSSLAFGSVNIGSSSVLSATLTNTGSSSVTVSSVLISGAGFNASGVSTGQIIGVGQTAALNVTFAPAASGAVAGSVTIASNASNSPNTISLSAAGAASHFTVLSWAPSTTAVIGYNVYRGTTSGGPYTKLTPSVISAMSYSDSGVQSGQTYYYVVTAVDSTNAESVYSNQVAAAIP